MGASLSLARIPAGCLASRNRWPTVHQVALPWHWGWVGVSTGDAANDLIALSGDPNVSIEESKAFTCDVRAGRRTREATEVLRDAHLDRHVAPDEDHPAEEPKLHGST